MSLHYFMVTSIEKKQTLLDGHCQYWASSFYTVKSMNEWIFSIHTLLMLISSSQSHINNFLNPPFIAFLTLACHPKQKQLRNEYGPAPRDSVRWASFGKAKGLQFYPRSGHMPGLPVHSWLEQVQKATDWCFSLTLMFLSFFSFLTHVCICMCICPSLLFKNK